MGSTNRVRTSEALRINSIWQDTIGLQNEHNNLAVEDRLNEGLLAHVRGIERKRDLAINCNLDKMMSLNNCAMNSERLQKILKLQNDSNPEHRRGSCKKCFEIGHLTKDCRNLLIKPYEDKNSWNHANIKKNVNDAIDKKNSSSLNSISNKEIKRDKISKKRSRKIKNKQKCSSSTISTKKKKHFLSHKSISFPACITENHKFVQQSQITKQFKVSS